MHTATRSISAWSAKTSRVVAALENAFALRRRLARESSLWRAVACVALLPSLAFHSAQAAGADPSKAIIERKLSSIIIPKVEFQQTPLRDAIESLRQEARRVDTDANPESRGVSIFLKLKSAGVARPAVDAMAAAGSAATVPAASTEPRITLSLSNLSFLTILREVARQAGLKVKVETYAVSIVPLDELTESLITAEFKVAPETFGAPSAPPLDKDGASPSRFDAMSWLKKKRITFPPGASATYLTSKGKLVVRNTQDNIDRIELLVTTPNSEK